MSDESRAHRWRRLISEEQEAFDRAKRNAETAGFAQRESFAREWLSASARLLKEHCRSHVVLHEGGPLEPYPGEAIGRAAALMEHLSTGQLPQVVKDLAIAGGRPDRSPGELRDLATAVNYLEYAKSGVIKDRAYNKTVATAFGVDRTTVQNWWRDRERICAGISKTPPDQIEQALEVAGKRYHFNRTGERSDGC